MRFLATGKRWRVLVACIAVPAVMLTLLGLWMLDLERVERRDQMGRQQRQTAMLAETRIEQWLIQLEREAPSDVPSFLLAANQDLLFLRDRTYFTDSGEVPSEVRASAPGIAPALVEQALAAEAQGDLARAIRSFHTLAADPPFRDWANFALMRLRSHQNHEDVLGWLNSLDGKAREALSPQGTPVMLLAARYVSRLPAGYQDRCKPLVISALRQMRAGKWWLSYQSRKMYDKELKDVVGSTEAGSDARLEEMAAIERIIRRTSPFSRERTTHLTALESGGQFLLIIRPQSVGWSGMALSAQRVSALLEAKLAPIRRDGPFAMAVGQSTGQLWWGERAALNGRFSLPIPPVSGWELHLGDAMSDDRGRQILWYTFMGLLLLMLTFGVVLTIRTTKQQMELVRMQSEFAAGVTHEFKSPITGIRLLVERIVSGRVLEQSALREYYSAVLRETDRLERLVNRLLETHRIQSGQNRYHLEPHCMIDIAETAIAHLRTQADAKQIRLKLNTDDVVREVEVDRTAMQDTIENLIDNAVKYSPPKTEIEIDITHASQELVLRVRDQGTGIDAEELPHIFDRFYRGRRHGQSVVGTGLGLPLVKAVAEGHGGSIEVKSQLGRGSEFCLRLPIRQEEIYVPSLDRG